MIVVGDSSRGNIHLILYMIMSTKFFNTPDIIYYYGCNILQDKIQYLREIYQQISKQVGYEILILDNNHQNISYADGFNNNNARKLVIFDDLLGLPKSTQAKISDHYIYGRQNNISSIYLAQHYTDVEQITRLN